MTEQVVQTDAGIQAALANVQIELGKQSTMLAVINTKLDNVIAAKDDHENRIRENTASLSALPSNLGGRLSDLEGEIPPKLEERLNAIENFKARLVGIGLAAGIFSGTIAGIIVWALEHH